MSIRWKEPKLGDQREVRRFLLLPRCLGGEWRWLGRERIVQVRRRVACLSPATAPFAFDVEKWVDVRWAS
jgi:hypothetical protein